jgi:hypothetical protein
MPTIPISSTEVRCIAAAFLVALAMPVTSQAQTLIPTGLRSEAYALMKVCRGDYDRLCSGVQPGGGRVLACLRSHANELSTACAQSLKDRAAASAPMAK